MRYDERLPALDQPGIGLGARVIDAQGLDGGKGRVFEAPAPTTATADLAKPRLRSAAASPQPSRLWRKDA